MKDLYSFDQNVESAFETYEEVQSSYSRFFSRLGIPFLAAKASSGDMGGDLSHEYHTVSNFGEDRVVSCDSCGYTVNEEIAESAAPSQLDSQGAGTGATVRVWRGISKDRRTLVNGWYPSDGGSTPEVSTHAIRRVVLDLDSSIEDAAEFWAEALEAAHLGKAEVALVNLVDYRLRHIAESLERPGHEASSLMFPSQAPYTSPTHQRTVTTFSNSVPIDLLRIQTGDACPKCKVPHLQVQTTLELGHTFYLGTRYSEPLGATVASPLRDIKAEKFCQTKVPIEMGCYGIGLTRVMGALADGFSDEKGLMWPLEVAPYGVAILPDQQLIREAESLYGVISSIQYCGGGGATAQLDAVVDDRSESMVWKMKDADLIGYPILVILGRAWRQGLGCEVQCRKLGTRENVLVPDLPAYLQGLLGRLVAGI
jgi:prolyl-tRNA synthetase